MSTVRNIPPYYAPGYWRCRHFLFGGRGIYLEFVWDGSSLQSFGGIKVSEASPQKLRITSCDVVQHVLLYTYHRCVKVQGCYWIRPPFGSGRGGSGRAESGRVRSQQTDPTRESSESWTFRPDPARERFETHRPEPFSRGQCLFTHFEMVAAALFFSFSPGADQFGRDRQTEGSHAGLQDPAAGHRRAGKPGDAAAPLAKALQGERYFF